jgi:hypothetical protein
MTAGDLITRWNRAVTGDQKKSFYNRTLARPYIDADQLPVTLEHCRLCVEEGKRAGITWQTCGSETYMGIDQMGGFNAVIIKKRLPDNRQAVIHVEAVFDLDPFERCAELMDLYGVAVCVVEQLPNVNDARKFMNRFPGRVFLAGYTDLKDDFLVWGDAVSRTDRKTAEDERTRYTVTLNQYKCMQVSLFRVRNQHCLFPDPNGLIQEVIERGERKRIAILQDWVFLHFTKTALVVEQDEETRKPKLKVMKVGIDPHFSYANMLCDVAWARSHGTSTFILPQAENPVSTDKTEARAALEQQTQNLPPTIKQMLSALDLPAGDVCGRCGHYQDKNQPQAQCGWRGFQVRAADRGCAYFVRDEG